MDEITTILHATANAIQGATGVVIALSTLAIAIRHFWFVVRPDSAPRSEPLAAPAPPEKK